MPFPGDLTFSAAAWLTVQCHHRRLSIFHISSAALNRSEDGSSLSDHHIEFVSEDVPMDSSEGSSPACGSNSSTLPTGVNGSVDNENFPTAAGEYVLVTGGLGFIGSHTSFEPLKAGYNVVLVDDLSNSHWEVFSRILAIAREHFDSHGGECPIAEFHHVNYRDIPAVRTLLQSHCTESLAGEGRQYNIIGVIHFAAFKAVEESIQHPLKYCQNNISGLVDFMALLSKYNIKTFIFSSSAVVDGILANGSRTLREEYCVHESEIYQDVDGVEELAQQGCVGITSPYGRTKFFGEAILSDLAMSDPSSNIVGLRYFNPIGCDASGLLGENAKETSSN